MIGFGLFVALPAPDPQAPERILSSVRSEIVLNGPWRFAPAVGSRAPEGAEWGKIWVPGDWKQSTGRPTVFESGQGWDKTNRDELSAAWYQRTLTVPPGWKGRAVLLELARVATDAEVYLDGQRMGAISWPEGTVDVTAAVKPGQEQTLRIRVVAAADAGEVPVLMGLGQVSARKADLAWRGIMGDVLLKSMPLGARVADVFVQPSVRRAEVALEVEIEGVAQAGEVAFAAEMRDEHGKVERTFRATSPVVAAPRQTVRLAWPWKDARRWDLGRPNLYTLRLHAGGVGLSDDYAQTFGFRELWTEGRRFMLNGTEFRMRPALENDGSGIDEVADGTIAALRARGFNIQEIWPENWETRGAPEFADQYADRADRAGWPLMGPSTHLNPVMSGWDTKGWDDPERRAQWIATYRRHLRRFQNHPSILLWANSGNNFGNRDDQAPTHIGRELASPVWKDEAALWRRGNERGREAYALMKTLDPTRPILAHQAGPISDVYAVNNYLNFTPLQEREEWLADWAKDGGMPYSAIEFGTPLDCSFFRGRNGFSGAYTSEPCFSEYAAIYAGPSAYATETSAYRDDIVKTFVGDQKYAWWMFVPSGNRLPAVESLQSLFVRNTWRSWRTWGVSGGMVPWSNAHGYDANDVGGKEVDLGPFNPGRRGLYRASVPRRDLEPNRPPTSTVHPAGLTLEANNGPTLAWIAGESSAFTEKGHTFRAGETMRKQIVLLNDTRDSVPYRFAWSVRVAGRVLAQGSDGGQLRPGETRLRPLTVVFPSGMVVAKSGEIRMEATIGGVAHTDAFDFRVHGADGFKAPDVALIDPVGKTRDLLKRLGIPARDWDGAQTDRLVVVGREAFVASPSLPARLLAFVRKGGRIVVMAQRPEWYTDYAGLRVAGTVSRRVYPIDSVQLDGIDAEDLRDWRGTSTLKLPFRPGASVPRRTPDDSPTYGWQGTGRGGVCSVPLEKPHRVGWRSLLQCEYDLSYSPLMEIGLGTGKLTLCTLDLEDHAPLDPGAERVARRVLALAAAPSKTPRSPVALLGDDADTHALELTGVRYRRVAALSPQTGIAVIGPKATLTDAAKRSFLLRGGRLLFLRRGTSESPYIGGPVPRWEECRGIDVADIHPKVAISIPALPRGVEAGGGGALGRERIGKGVALYLQLSPEALDADGKTYLRRTRWNQTRTLTVLLANLGAGFDLDDAVLDGRMAVRDDSLSLAGKWRAVITRQLPDGTHEDPGITPEAQRLLAAGPLTGTEVNLPATYDELGKPWSAMDGEAVFRRDFDAPATLLGHDAEVDLGAIDDFDEVWINGRRVGGIGAENREAYSIPRRYAVPRGLLLPKGNRIAIRVWDRFGGGGFYPRPGAFQLRPLDRPKKGLYSADYRKDFELGDDPYRYYRW
ncbi:hypothetical protein BH11ARM2_BH11ARM2_18750 [soil metagenome]